MSYQSRRRGDEVALGLFQGGPLALDIGASSVTAIELAGSGSRVKLRRFCEAPLPDGLVVDGEIVDADLFGRELKGFVHRNGLRGRSTQVSVSNQKVIVRNIDMPEMTEAELIGAIEYQAQDYIPIPVEDAVLDFQILGKRTDPEGQPRQEVLLVAAQRTMVDTLLTSLKQAGLKVSGVDVSSLAIIRALVPAASFLADPAKGGVCRGLVDISSSVSTLVVAVDDVLKFTRVINFSSDRFAKVISEQRGIPFEDAVGLVQAVGLPGPLAPQGDVYSSEVVAETQRQVSKAAAELVDEIRRSFDYYHGQDGAIPLNELVLSGRGTLVRNLDTHLAEALELPVIVGNPLSRVSQNGSSLSDDELALIGPSLAVAIGLGLPEDD
jgi:type IV pilus assembly protein PilM